MSTCAADKPPIFWQRQPRFPLPVLHFVRARLEAALQSPLQRAHLVWPVLIGAPGMRSRFPAGIPEAELLAQAGRLLAPYGILDAAGTWALDRDLLPDTGVPGASGWLPGETWSDHAELVSLRCGVALLALMGLPEDARYRFAAGVALFNSALYYECHDALETLWSGSRGRLRSGLQGLILLASGFHHQQMHHGPGMLSLWEDALKLLSDLDGTLETPWGTVDFSRALEAAAERMIWLEDKDDTADLSPLWNLRLPALELVP
jgi:hypothetical protein